MLRNPEEIVIQTHSPYTQTLYTKKATIKWLCINGVPKGIRTPVAAVKGQCPRPLDDGDNIRICPEKQPTNLQFGGARRDRTADLLRATQALSQLSYSPVFSKIFSYYLY